MRLSSSRYHVPDILMLSVFCLFFLLSLCLCYCLCWCSRLLVTYHFFLHEAEVWPMSLFPLVFSLLFPDWHLSRYPSQNNAFNCLLSPYVLCYYLDLYILLHVIKFFNCLPSPVVHPNIILISLSRSRMQSWAERLWCCRFLTLIVSPSTIWLVR